MTGSFLFVKPSDPEGKPGTAYSGESPTYAYDHASWEWLLERALRRTLLPWALTKTKSGAILSLHEDQYSMHRWGSYGESYKPGKIPVNYPIVGGPGVVGEQTDADLSKNDRTTLLPIDYNQILGEYDFQKVEVAYGVADIEKTVSYLPFSLEWLYPGWTTDDLDKWDLTASTTETTTGRRITRDNPDSNGGAYWRWETAVEHIPYTIPEDLPFKCLSHMRTDNPTLTVDITNDDNTSIQVETARTPMSAPRTTGGSLIDIHGMKFRDALRGAAIGAGWALYEFYIDYSEGLDYSKSTSLFAYGRDNKTSEDSHSIGCLVDPPDDKSDNICVKLVNDVYVDARVIHEVDWGGYSTWWHMKGFPKGLDSVLSPKLKEQLEALCPKCQPAIPPAIPAFLEKFPDTKRLQWTHTNDFTGPGVLHPNIDSTYPPAWMRHLTLACTPFDMSKRLDAMTTTVHRVPYIFAKIKTVERESSTQKHYGYTEYSDGTRETYPGIEETNSTEITVEGASSEPIPISAPWVSEELRSVTGEGSGVSYFHYTVVDPAGSYDSYNRYVNSFRESVKSHSDFIVCLHSTNNTILSTKTTKKTSSFLQGEEEISDGKLPVSYDPDPDDLFFPDWILPWIETAELFASIESSIIRVDGAHSTEGYESVYKPVEQTGHPWYYGGGSGTRTHKVHRKIVSLGKINKTTGRFLPLDAGKLLSEVDPDATRPTRKPLQVDYDYRYTRTVDKDGTTTIKDFRSQDESTPGSNGRYSNVRKRKVSYYVVVKWLFDRTDPETIKAELPIAGLYRKLDDAMKALSDKRRELSDARAALEDAESDLKAAEKVLRLASDRLEDPEGAKPELIAEAQDKLNRAKKALSEAKSKKSDAQSEYDSAERDMTSAKAILLSAQAAYDAAVNTGKGVEEAEAVLVSAETNYNKVGIVYSDAFIKLTAAEADEAMAQLDVDAAQDYYDTLPDKIKEILQKAVDIAKKAVDETTARVKEWTKKIEEIEKAIPDLENAVKAAEQAIREAEDSVPNS